MARKQEIRICPDARRSILGFLTSHFYDAFLRVRRNTVKSDHSQFSLGAGAQLEHYIRMGKIKPEQLVGDEMVLPYFLGDDSEEAAQRAFWWAYGNNAGAAYSYF